MKQNAQKVILIEEAPRAARPAHTSTGPQAVRLSAEEREQLILDHLPQVRLIARRTQTY